MAKTKTAPKTAREQALDLGWTFHWEHDDMPYHMDAPRDGDPMPDEVLVCLLKNEQGMVRGSLSGIGDPSQEYAREIEDDLAHEALATQAKYCVPLQCGLASSERAVAARLSRLLTALDNEITANVVSGDIVGDVDAMKSGTIRRLRAAGWRVSAHPTQDRWVVLPPVRARRRS